MAKKGEWARIHNTVLEASQRAPQVPDDTKKCALEMWVKGFLKEDAQIGEETTVITVTGREAKGTLVEVNPYYDHSFGRCIPELFQIDQQLREVLFGGDN